MLLPGWDLGPARGEGWRLCAGGVTEQEQAAKLVGAPDDEGERQDGAELTDGEWCRAEDAVERGQVDQRGGECQGDRDSPSRNRLENTLTERNDAWSVRTANAVPIWQVTMPSQATVVAAALAAPADQRIAWHLRILQRYPRSRWPRPGRPV